MKELGSSIGRRKGLPLLLRWLTLSMRAQAALGNVWQ
jgi:hypothetical protein